MTKPFPLYEQFPDTYEKWRYCVEVKCGAPLERAFIMQRLQALENREDTHTQQFIALYGEQWWRIVMEWFRQALRDLE